MDQLTLEMTLDWPTVGFLDHVFTLVNALHGGDIIILIPTSHSQTPKHQKQSKAQAHTGIA
jgi:hypothetical protein